MLAYLLFHLLYILDWLHYLLSPSRKLANKLIGNEENIDGKVIIVTGSNSGIGKAAALQLANRRAKVILACRNLEKAETARQYIQTKVPHADLDVMKLDLADLSSIHRFVDEFKKTYNKLDILVNNAGFVSIERVLNKTVDNFESHMGVNHFGPFLLTHLLLDSLKNAESSKIICVSTSYCILSRLDTTDFLMEDKIKTGRLGYEPYILSKQANFRCMQHLATQLPPSIRIYNMCPGLCKTELFDNLTGCDNFTTRFASAFCAMSPKRGCESIILCALSKTLSTDPEHGKGEFFRFNKLWKKGTDFASKDTQVNKQVYEISEKLTGLSQQDVARQCTDLQEVFVHSN